VSWHTVGMLLATLLGTCEGTTTNHPTVKTLPLGTTLFHSPDKGSANPVTGSPDDKPLASGSRGGADLAGRTVWPL
jgi:hypothetical protein